MKKLFILLLVFCLQINSVVAAVGISNEQRRLMQSGINYFNVDPDCGAGSAPAEPTPADGTVGNLTYSAAGKIPATGLDVGASVFGGKGDDPGNGNGSGSLVGKSAYAELSNPGTQDYSALGKLPDHTKLQITYKGKSIVAEKLDVGKGGGAVEGKPRAVDLWHEAAKLLNFPGLGVINIHVVDPSTPTTPVDGQASSVPDASAATPPSTTGGPIYVVGDSITAGMKPKLQKALTDAGFTPTINGQGSRPLYYPGGKSGAIIDGFTAVDNDKVDVGRAETVVIGLGTNKQGGGEAEYRQKVGEMIDKVRGISPSARIFWTNMVGSGTTNTYSAYNKVLTDLSVTKIFTIIDWASIGTPNLPPNNVHPTPTGYDALVKLVVTSVSAAGVAKKPADPSTAQCACPTDPSPTASSPGGGVATKSIGAFVDAYGQFAYDNSLKTGVPYDFTLGQAIIESGYGQSGLTKQANNFFGIKAGGSWTGETITLPTREVLGGKSVTVMAAFRKYATPQDSFADHDRFFHDNKRYAAALQYPNDPFRFLAEIKKAGYATDPAYVVVVGNVIKGVQSYIAGTGKWPPSSEVVYQISAPVPGDPAAAGGPASATDSGVCSATVTGGGGIEKYKNPFRDVPNIHQGGIDAGVDYTGDGPVYAIGAGAIIRSGRCGWVGGNCVSYLLREGPAAGKVIYVSENCTYNPDLKPGDSVTSDTRLCTMHNTYPYIETGWAKEAGTSSGFTPLAYADKCYYITNKALVKTSTNYGVNFDQLMNKLGAPKASLISSNVTCTLPSGFPSW